MRTSEGQAATLSKKELKIFLARVKQSESKWAARNYLIMLLSFRLGLRAKELAALTVNNVWLFESEQLHDNLCLLKTQTKGEKTRELPLSHPEVKVALAEWISLLQKKHGTTFNPELPLFITQKRRQFTAGRMVEAIKLMYANAGGEFAHLSSHSGRRTFITHLANKGVDLNSLRILAGHESVTTTQLYIDANPITLAKIMQQA